MHYIASVVVGFISTTIGLFFANRTWTFDTYVHPVRGVQHILYSANGAPLEGSKFRLQLGMGTGMGLETDKIHVMTRREGLSGELGRPLSARFMDIPGVQGKKGWVLEENVKYFSNGAGNYILKEGQAE